jgi:hypothetical protein
MKCASTRSTICSPRSPEGTWAAGIRPWRAAMRSHTRARTPARVASRRCRQAASISPRVRHRSGRRGDLTVQVFLVAQDVDGAQGVTAIGHHDRRVDQDPAPVVARAEVAAAQGVGHRCSQTRAVGGQPQRGGAGVGDDVLTVGGDGQPGVPSGRVVHAKSAFRFGILLASTPRFSQLGGTFLCLLRHCASRS